MRIIVQTKPFLAACLSAKAATAGRGAKPVLQNFKVVAADGVELMATDLEIGIRTHVDADVRVQGTASLPADRLIAILRESTDADVTIDADRDGCVVTGAGWKFNLPGADPDDFPDVPKLPEEGFDASAGLLREALRRTIFAADEKGVLLERDGSVLTLAATDGRRLAVMPVAIPEGVAVKGQIPVKAAKLWEKVLTDPDTTVRVSLSLNEAFLATTDATIYSRLVDGRFPNYRQVIPAKYTHRATLTVDPFLAALRQAAITTDAESICVKFTFKGSTLTLEASGAKTGKSHVEVPVEYEGSGIGITFNPRYFVDALRVFEPLDTVTLEMTSHDKPAVLRAGDYTYVVVPLTGGA